MTEPFGQDAVSGRTSDMADDPKVAGSDAATPSRAMTSAPPVFPLPPSRPAFPRPSAGGRAARQARAGQETGLATIRGSGADPRRAGLWRKDCL